MQRLSADPLKTTWSENLIVRREWARRGGQAQLAGFCQRALLMLVIPMVWGLAAHNDLSDLVWILLSGLPFLGLAYFVRAALNTLPAVSEERERQTWDGLVESGMSLAEFRKGWLLVGAVPLWVETVPMVLVIAGLLAAGGLGGLEVGLSSLLLGLALGFVTWVGAKLGLTLSAEGGNFRSLVKLTLLAFLAGCLMWCGSLLCFERELHALPLFCQLHASRIAWVGFPLLSLWTVGGFLQAWSEERLTQRLGLSPAPSSSGWLRAPMVGAVLAAGLVYPRLKIPLRLISSPLRIGSHIFLLLAVPLLVAYCCRGKAGGIWPALKATLSASLLALITLGYDRIFGYIILDGYVEHIISFVGGVGLSLGLGLVWGGLELTVMRCWSGRRG